jgi:hypothetical protein
MAAEEKIANSYDDCGLKKFEEKLISKTKKKKRMSVALPCFREYALQCGGCGKALQ